jgi:DNA-binding XRE family transcriptional regulator
MNYSKVRKISVFLLKRTKKTLVGEISLEGEFFKFQYNQKYLESCTMELSSEFPLTDEVFSNVGIFKSLRVRIPESGTDVYDRLKEKFSLGEDVSDFGLLASMGQKDLSSFEFAPVNPENEGLLFLKKVRKETGLSRTDIAEWLEISKDMVFKLESGKREGFYIMKILDIYRRFPEVAIDDLNKGSYNLNKGSRKVLEEYFKSKVGG